MAMAISRALLYQDLKKKDHQMMQSEKLAALGEMAASFVHGIRNPLNIILASAETLKKKVPGPVQSELLQFVREESERINKMLTSFLDFAKPRPPVFREVDLKEILGGTAASLSGRARERQIQIIQEYPGGNVPMYLDPEQIREALVNLESECSGGHAPGGTLRLSLTQKENHDVIIRVSDTGVGLPDGAESKIFDPFFTTKDQGTGLGLSIVHAIVKNHGGAISVVSNDGGGATFLLTLPTPRGTLGCFGAVGPAPAGEK